MSTEKGFVKLAKLGAWLLNQREEYLFGDVDGCDLQEACAGLAVLEEKEATEPCGEGCVCAEWDDFPQKCFFIADDVREALELLDE